MDSIELISQREILGESRGEDDKFSHEELSSIAHALNSLSQKYTLRTKKRPALTQDEVAAYVLYYLPVNAYKVRRLLAQIPHILNKTKLNVLDFGSGPGTASLALATEAQSQITINLFDTEPLMITAAQSLLKKVADKISGVHITDSSLLSPHGSYDLIFACNVLNECSSAEYTTIFNRLRNVLSPTGVIIFLEPGTLDATRTLMELRDQIAPEMHIQYPCTHRNPCPLLADESQWCHTSIFYDRSSLITQLDTLTGFNKHRIKYSALIVGGDSTPSGCRVLTPASKNKLGSSALVCGETYFGMLELPKRNRTDSNRLFDKTHQHDRIEISPPPTSKILPKNCTIK